MQPITAPIRCALAASLLAGLGLSACGHDAAAVPQGDGAIPADAGAEMKTLPTDTDPCGWISADEAAKLLGPLAGAPWRASHSDGPEADRNGRACVYPLGGDDKIAVELVTEDPTSYEGGVALVAGRLSSDAGKKAAGDVIGALAADSLASAGWDYVGWLPSQFLGRLGHMVIQVGIYGQRVPADSVARLASIVRDRIPDVPMATPRGYSDHGEGPDPCKLITREEAETLLGKLAIPPYRSNSKKSASVDPGGEGCSYYLGRHRIFTIDATWEQGKMTFGMSTGMGQNIAAILGVNGSGADTLDGGWDQAGGGPAGSLYFLKGDQMLEITYLTAAVDVNAAVRLARLAVSRLK